MNKNVFSMRASLNQRGGHVSHVLPKCAYAISDH